MTERFQIFNGDCLEVMRTFEAESIDSIVTDPPAGISFMNKSWDSDKGGRDEWIAWLTSVMRESLRVLKPGGHALVWALPRTSHWTATALENAGFEIRDLVNHLFGSGFPKSLDISKAIDKMHGAERKKIGWYQRPDGTPRNYEDWKGRVDSVAAQDWQPQKQTAPATDEAKQWEGFGTALKPACEHWILCRKPLSEKTIAENVLKWGVGGLNIDDCRIETSDNTERNCNGISALGQSAGWNDCNIKAGIHGGHSNGRFPANVIHDGSDEVEAEFAKFETAKECGSPKRTTHNLGMFGIGTPGTIYKGESASPSRFFYCAKASKSDRGETNKHPTVKATPLMQYLCRLITPPDGIVLDCFMGSGSTGKAAMKEGFRFIGIELEKESCDEAQKRIESAIEPLFQTA